MKKWNNHIKLNKVINFIINYDCYKTANLMILVLMHIFLLLCCSFIHNKLNLIYSIQFLIIINFILWIKTLCFLYLLFFVKLKIQLSNYFFKKRKNKLQLIKCRTQHFCYWHFDLVFQFQQLLGTEVKLWRNATQQANFFCKKKIYSAKEGTFLKHHALDNFISIFHLSKNMQTPTLPCACNKGPLLLLISWTPISSMLN